MEIALLNDKLFVSNRLLTGYGFDTIKQRNHDNRKGIRTSYASIKHNGEIFTAFDTIPAATREAKGMPTREEIIKQYQGDALQALVAFNDEAYNYFIQRAETNKRAKEKAEQASWLLAIAAVKPTVARGLGFASKEIFYAAAINAMAQAGWKSWKCTTIKALRKKLTPFQKHLKNRLTLAEACATLVSGKNGNTNRSQLTTDQHALLVQLFSDPAKLNFEQVWGIYTRKASELVKLGLWEQKALVLPGAVRSFLSKPRILQMCYEPRHGHQAYRQVYEPVTTRFKPTYANALWVIDGTPLHRYFQGADGSGYKRWNYFVVLDAYSQRIIGFWVGRSEDSQSVLNALRNACAVSGCLPHQVLYDNGSAIQSYVVQQALEKISVVAFPARAGNARSKVVEGWFHFFNDNVGKFRKGYTGNPFAARIDNRPNREALSELVKTKQLSHEAQGLQELREDITLCNNLKRPFLGNKSAMQAYLQSVKDTAARQRPFTEAIDIEAFYTLPGEIKRRTVFDEGRKKQVSVFEPQRYEFTNRGLAITINGKRCEYDIEEAAFRRTYIGAKFTVRYEPDPQRWTGDGQPGELLLYLDGKPLMWDGAHVRAHVKEIMPMGVADYSDGSAQRIRELIKNKRKQRAMAQQDYEELVQHTKDNGTYTEVITANAFDKEILQATEAALLNQIVHGDGYNLSLPPAGDGGPKPDRLEGFDEPLPLE